MEAGTPFAVLEYRHTKMGRGTANVRVKVRDLKSGATLEKTFISGASVEEGEVLKKKAQYLYSDEASLYFMDPQTFEQFSVPAKMGEGAVNFLREGEDVTVAFFDNEPVAVELPLKVNLRVTEAPPGNKGDTRQGGNKEAVLETGHKVQVPLFIKADDTVTVNTETGEYAGRV